MPCGRRNRVLGRVYIGATWQIRWNDLLSGSNGGCRYRCCIFIATYYVFNVLRLVKSELICVVFSLSDPSRVGYRRDVETDSPPATWNAIGPEVKHIYEVRLFV